MLGGVFRMTLTNRDRESAHQVNAELAVLRVGYAGVAVRPAVERYLPSALGDGIGSWPARAYPAQVAARVRAVDREDMAPLFDHTAQVRAQHAKTTSQRSTFCVPRSPRAADRR